eukprot:2361432-Pleurochrysis_carterae.AAC.2
MYTATYDFCQSRTEAKGSDRKNSLREVAWRTVGGGFVRRSYASTRARYRIATPIPLLTFSPAHHPLWQTRAEPEYGSDPGAPDVGQKWPSRGMRGKSPRGVLAGVRSSVATRSRLQSV